MPRRGMTSEKVEFDDCIRKFARAPDAVALNL